jgi:hypothetical protein
MLSESDLLMSDPADEGVLYAPVEAWEPMCRGTRRLRMSRRAETVRTARPSAGPRTAEEPVSTVNGSAQSVSLDFPVIHSDMVSDASNVAWNRRVFADFGRCGAETKNLVSQSAFLKALPVAQVVTQCTMSPRVHILGATMQKSDFFSARTSTSTSTNIGSLSGLSTAGFARSANEARADHTEFMHSAPPSLTAERLDGYGARWLQSLPVSIRPLITAKRHPHIVNKLAIFWGIDDAVDAYFDELLISARPGRRGFAMEVLDELVELQRAVQEKRRF